MGRQYSARGIYDQLKAMVTYSNLKQMITNPAKLHFAAFFIVVAELILNILIVDKVPYTEIDWKAYMQECEGVLNGTYDYSLLRGDTGPLVYPAGFVYVYSALYYITGHGTDIKLAQYIFIAIYLLQLILVLRIYIKSNKVPPYVLVLTTLSSYRIHSIYVLRLFNDPIAVLFLYAALNLFIDSKFTLGSLFYSLGVSIKMNVLLYAPALFFFYLINVGMTGTAKQLLVCGLVQVVLAAPFLLTNPVAYVKGSFDFGRVFNHTWTVNYRFLSVETFENRCFHLTLLAIHILLLILFLPLCLQYFRSYCRLRYVQKQVQPQIDAQNDQLKMKEKKGKNIKKKKPDEKLSKDQLAFLNSFEAALKKQSQKGKQIEEKEESQYSINFDIVSQLFILPMFIVNFIGVVCARSLHYQFYSWYFHSLPYLLWSNNYSVIVRFLILALIEMSWNTYPSTIFSSALLHVCHVTVLYGVYRKVSSELKMAAKVS